MISRLFSSSRRSFESLSDEEILALAISAEEDDARIYRSYADGLREDYPASAEVFDRMAEEENLHRQSLIDLFKQRFGDTIPLIRRDHVQGYYERKPDWLVRPLNLEKTRAQAEDMERQAARFYQAAAARTSDADTRRLLGDLAIAESEHQEEAVRLEEQLLTDDVRESEDKDERRQFLLTYVQPGLAGLMDGSISTLAPIFAAAFATGDTWKTFLVGLSASVGAGISMGFTEAAHDDGVLSGRGSPIKRGLSSGIMTTIGGLGHTLPYLIPDFKIATGVAIAIVFVELWAITWIQNRYMETPWGRAAFQVLLGGALVFAAGIIIGNA
jgi:rubrerythrin